MTKIGSVVLLAATMSAAMPSVPAIAAPLTMKCKNPSRFYVARFDQAARKFHADDTAYTVLAVENAGGKLVVAGTTVNNGPAFRAEFRPSRKIEFYMNDKLFQTDKCS